MTFSDMVPCVIYEITSPSSDKTFSIDDVVAIFPDDSICINDTRNRIEKSDYEIHPEMIDFTCKVSIHFFLYLNQQGYRICLLPNICNSNPWDLQIQEIEKSKRNQVM